MALAEMDGDEQILKAIEAYQTAYEMDRSDIQVKKELDLLVSEMEKDSHVPVPEEKEKVDALFKKMHADGATSKKLKMRYYGPSYRGVVASRDMREGEIIL